jgi:hypothetical protein
MSTAPKGAKPYDIRWPLTPQTLEDINATFDELFKWLATVGTGTAAPSSGGGGGVVSITGTAKEIIVGGSASHPVLSTPQDIDTDSSVQFAAIGAGLAPEAGSKLKIGGHFYATQTDDGNSGAAKTIDWAAGNEHVLTLTAACTLTFSNPKAGAHYVLVVTQNGTGGWAITWPGTVVWSGGVQAELLLAAAAVSLIAFYYNGTSYIAAGANASALAQGLPEVPLSVPHGGTGLFSVANGEVLAGTTGGNNFTKIAAPTSDGDLLTAAVSVPGKMAWTTPAVMGTCAAHLSSDTTLTGDTEKVFDFDAESWDVGGYHSNVTNPSRLTVPAGKAGYYLVSAGVGFGAVPNSVAQGKQNIRIYVNGALVAEARCPTDTIAAAPGCLTVVLLLAVADYVQVAAITGSGLLAGTQAINAGATRTFLRVAQLR